MLYWVYILQSECSGRHYCGSTDDVERRLRQHNDPDYHGSETTKRFAGPWKLVWRGQYTSRAQAMAKERQIKGRGIGRFLEEIGRSVESRLGRD